MVPYAPPLPVLLPVLTHVCSEATWRKVLLVARLAVGDGFPSVGVLALRVVRKVELLTAANLLSLRVLGGGGSAAETQLQRAHGMMVREYKVIES